MKKLKIIFSILSILAMFSWTTPAGLFALPEGETVEHGYATFERPDPATTNNILTLKVTADDGSVINFNSFNISRNEAVYFIQPSRSASLLSRVIGAVASEIAGMLFANGTLFFVNPNGIHFTPSAQVSVNNLVASTLDISTNNFINGDYFFQRAPDGAGAQIINEGRITGDNIALIASGVHNAGLIVASAGTAHLASGDKVTVSFDKRGLIQVEIDEETSGMVVDTRGETIKDAVANSGSIEAQAVMMSARTASDIFEKAVNQTGIVKATGMVQENGVIRIRANRTIQVSGSLQAPQGNVQIASEESVVVGSELKTIGNTEVAANQDIKVYADISTEKGDLALLADADLDGAGSFIQAQGTLISTIGSGNITIQSSGEGALAGIASAGDLMLQQGGAAASFNQQPDSRISTAGSMTIGPGVTINAANTLYNVGKDWVNLGIFNPQDSTVGLVSDKPALVSGSTIFNNLNVVVPGKQVIVSAGDTITIRDALTVQGAYGNLAKLVSSEPGKQWMLLALGKTDIAYAQIADCLNVRGPPLETLHSSSLGNNSHLNIGPFWTGQGQSNLWSDPDNWDSGVVPTPFDTVTFDGMTGLNPNKNSVVDIDFSGTIAFIKIEGYAGTITLGRDINISGDINLKSGSFKAENHAISVGGNWVNEGGDFQAGTSTVAFYDSSRPSRITGNNAFYGFISVTPSKELIFEAGKTTTILGSLELRGSYAQHVKLLSSVQGEQWYIAPRGSRDISYSWVEDSYNLDPQIIMMTESTNRGNSYNWDPVGTWTGNVSNLWSVAGNWIGLGGAAPGAGDDLVFPSSAAIVNTNNDFAAGTSFNSITITGGSYTLAGNSIILGAGGLIANNIAGANTVSLDISFGATRTVTVTNADETLTISGVISGAAGAGLTKAGSGTLILSGANTYQGDTTINAGTVSIASDSGLGQAPGAPTVGHLTLNGGTLQATAVFSLNTNRGIALGASGGIVDITTDDVLTYAGVIAGANALQKVGAGELILQGVNTNSSTVTVNGGTLTLSGANGTMTSATFTVNQGAVLNLDNSANGTNNTNRISNTNALTLTGGEFIFRGTNTASTNATETVGALTLTLGFSRVTTFSGTGGQTILTFASASRSAGATVLFRGTNLGSNPGAGNTNIRFTNATGLSLTGGGGVAGSQNINIVPYAFGGTTAVSAGTGFVTHNIDTNGNTNGIRPLILATEYTQNAYTSGNNIRIAAATNFTTTVAVNSLLIDGGNVNFNTNTRTLTISSGAVARVSGGDITSTSATSRVLAFGAVEGKFFCAGDLIIQSAMTGTAGYVKSGSGTLTLNIQVKGITGGVTINEGSLTIGINNAVNSANTVTIAAPGAFDIGNYTLTVTSLILYSGNTSGASLTKGTGALTLLAAGGGSVTLNVNGAGAVGATMSATGTGSLALGASRTFTINDGDALEDMTIAMPISGSSLGITKEGSGTLALIKANTYTGVTTLNAGTLSVAIMADGGRASGVGASTNAATNLVLNGGTFKYTGVTSRTNRLFTIGTTSPVTLDVSGVGTLTFTGASITLSGTNTARTVTFTGSGAGILTNVISDNGTGATTIVKNGPGSWSFNGANTYTGTTTINGGTLAIAADSGLGTAPASATPGSVTLSNGTLRTTATFTLDANRGIAFSGAATISTSTGTTLTYGGIIAGSGIFTKDGAGALALEGTNTYDAPTVVNNGTLTFSGANGSGLNSISFTINPEATLNLDNTGANNVDRIGDAVEIRMNGGYFNFIGNSSASSYETTGELRIISGSNYVSVRDSTGGATIMTFSSFSRIAGSMALFRGTNLGSAPGSNVSTIMFTSAPALTGGGGNAGTSTVSIIQGAFGSGSPTGWGTDMVTYNIVDNPFGLRLLNEGGFTGEYETGALTVPNSNVKLTGSVAPGPGVTINSLILASGGAVASSANTLTIGSGNILALPGNAGINGSTILAFGSSPGIIRSVIAEIVISSQITGSAGLTTGGTGTITLSNAANSFTGSVRISQGTVKIAQDAVLGLGSGAENITIFAGTLQTTATFTLDSGRGILLKGPGSILTDPSTTLTYNGVVSGPGSLTKDGAGTLLLGGTNTYAGDTIVNAGTMTFSGANSYSGDTTINGGELIFSGANGSALKTSSVIISAGGTLTLDNSSANNTNRLAVGASINMLGGDFNYIGSGSAAASEEVGGLLLLSGSNRITVTPGAGGSTTLTFANFSRNAGAMALFRGTSLGSVPAASVSTIYFDEDPLLVGGGGAAGSPTISIISGAFGDGSLTGTGAEMVTYESVENGGYGLRLLTAAEYGATFTTNYNVKLSSGTAPGSTLTITSLTLNEGGVVNTSSRTVTIASGNILNTSTTGQITNSTVIAFGGYEGIILNTSNLSIRSNMTGSAGVTYSGAGTTTLQSLVKGYTGMTTVNDGILTIGINNAINSAGTITVGPGATLLMSGSYTEQITSLVLYSGSNSGATITTGTGNLTLLAAGGGSVTLNVNGSGAVGAVINTTGTGQLALGASRVFTVNDGAASDDLAVSAVISGSTFGITKNGAGTLVLSGNNTYTGANTINAGTLAVTANNALGTVAGITTVNSGTLDFRNVAYSTAEPLTLAAGSTLMTSAGTSSFAGAVTMTAPSIIVVEGTQLTLSGAIANGGFRLTVGGSGNTIISNTLTGSGGLAKQDTGTLTLSNTVTLGGNLTISRGTLAAGSNTITVSGNWTNNGSFISGTSTVTFTGGSSVIDPGGTDDLHDFYRVIINASGTKTLAGPIMINNVLQVDAGIFAGDYDVTVKGGSVTGNGTINMTDGTFTVQGTGSFGNSTNAWTFYSLTFGDGATTATTTKTGNNTINVTSTLAVALYHTLQAGTNTTWNLVWTSYLKNISMIASGYDHTLALTDDGYVFGWGNNAYGQLGDGTINDGLVPVQVLSGEQGGGTYLQNISKIAAGGYHSVAMASNGSVFSWGYNEYGQMGNNSTTDSWTPVQVRGVGGAGYLSGIAQVAAGGFQTAAVSATGFVFSWGYNEHGELGNNMTTSSSVPVQVLSGEQGGGTYLQNISKVAVGGAHALALGTDGFVYGWGYNADGALGNNTTTDSWTPVRVLSGGQGGGAYLRYISQIAAGDAHSLALATTGFVYSWGYNSDGQLGNNTTTSSSTPVRVLSGEQGGGAYLQNVSDISAGAAHSLVIASGGYVYSWGQNTWGQLGNNSTADSATPVRVLSGDQGSETYLHGIADIAAGGAQTVALSFARPVFNCGNNANGQLGNGTTVGAVEQIRVLAGSQAGPVITQLVVTGVLESQSSTFNYSNLYQPNINIAPITYNNLTLSNSAGTFWLTGSTIVSGNLIINSATLSAGSYGLTVSGNWTNTAGTFNPGSGTVTFNSSTQAQTVTSGGSAFNILTITNSHIDGVIFADRLFANTLNAGTGVRKLSFSSESESSPHTITASFNVSGSVGNLIELAPIVPFMTWYLDAPTSSLQYLKVGYSHQADGKTITATSSQSDGGNTNWNITP